MRSFGYFISTANAVVALLPSTSFYPFAYRVSGRIILHTQLYCDSSMVPLHYCIQFCYLAPYAFGENALSPEMEIMWVLLFVSSFLSAVEH